MITAVRIILIIALVLGLLRAPQDDSASPDDGITWSPYGPFVYGHMHHIPVRKRHGADQPPQSI